MPNYCVVCRKYQIKGDGRSFHRFPLNKERQKLWVLQLKMVNFCPRKYECICSDHFKETDFILRKSGIKVLKENAAPFIPKNLTASMGHSSKDQEAAEHGAYPHAESFIGMPSVKRKFDMLYAAEVEEASSDSTKSLKSTPSSPEKDVHEKDFIKKKAQISLSQEISSSTMTASEGAVAEGSSGTLTGIESIKSSPASTKLEKEPPKKRKRLSRKVFVGDISTDDFGTPKKAKKAFKIAKNKILIQKRKIDALRKKNTRFRTKIRSMSSLLTFLKQKNYISETAQECIQASLPGSTGEIVDRMLRGTRRAQFSPAIRAFALTLHFYSPRAYSYVREKFQKALPHPSTIAKWYQNVDGSPGFTKESFNALKIKVNSFRESGKEVYCNLVMDEMSIRKKTEWDGHKFYGCIDTGSQIQGDTLPEAKEVLVFLVTSVNGHWKIPVGYFCIDGLSGSERANLVRNCLQLLHEIGVNISSLTFDGAASNISMANQLGANLSNPHCLKCHFSHPITQEKVYVFLDICHMIKLIRNCLGDFKIIKTKYNKFIKWAYLEELVKLQDTEGLNAATKIKKRHLQYVKEKMRVKIATQTFSKSVCDALKYLEIDLKLDAFQGAEETAIFCELMNDVFDILNSRNRFSSYLYKRALSQETENMFFQKFNHAKEYILGLTLNDKPILSSNRKTGFLGLLLGMESFRGIYNDYVKTDKLSFLLGYKFSQDHLETLFSAVRSLHGFNNNPTARQFQSAYKKLIISREVRGADTANAVALDSTLILNVSSRKITVNDCNEDLEDSKQYVNLCSELNDHDFFGSSGWQLSSYLEDVVVYIAGFVVKTLQKCVTCSKCLALLESNEIFSMLQQRKTYGNLFKASKFVITICTWGEKTLRIFLAKSDICSTKHKNIIDHLVGNTVRVLPDSVFRTVGDHLYDGDLLDNHQLSLIKIILKRYFSIRIHHETRKKSDQMGNRVRSLLTHLILFKNQ